MKRSVLPVVLLMAVSVITVGMVIGASSGAEDQTTVMTNSPAEQWTAASVTTQSRVAATPGVVITQLSPKNSGGNWRHPGVGEDSRGNRLVIFRGADGKKYYYTYCKKGGTWSSPKAIYGGNQPVLVRTAYVNIRVDSMDRFHCTWEEAKGAVYATFRDGIWTKPGKIPTSGRFDIFSSLAIRSNDELVFADCEVVGLNKEVWLHTKRADEPQFKRPFNISRDKLASCQPAVAVDSKDNSWVVWKSDFYLADPKIENLVIYLGMFLKDNKDGPIDWQVVSPNPGWSFLPQVAVNNEDKVMTLYAYSKGAQYMSRLFDPATKKLGPMVSLNIGLCRQPWHTFYSKMAAHGKDFYAAGLTGGRLLILLKFDEEKSKWNQVAQVSDRAAEMFDLYAGYDHMLVAWNNNNEPVSTFVTTVSVDPYPLFRLKSVSNLKVEKRVESSFFRSYSVNVLTWKANPDNTKKNIPITAHRVYRKGRTEANTQWTRIAVVAGTDVTYVDTNVSSGSDYVYAVTCVDDKDNESAIY